VSLSGHLTELISGFSLSSLPRLIWQYYLEYLWFYEPSSWVGRIAHIFQILAFMMILPMVLFSLLDVTTYVIARTLGVVDDVKASTSDKITIHAEGGRDVPSIVLTASSPTPASDPAQNVLPNEFQQQTNVTEIMAPVARHSPPQTFFASDDMQLKLSGEGVFSPAASVPSSPTLKRRRIANLERTNDEE